MAEPLALSQSSVRSSRVVKCLMNYSSYENELLPPKMEFHASSTTTLAKYLKAMNFGVDPWLPAAIEVIDSAEKILQKPRNTGNRFAIDMYGIVSPEQKLLLVL